MIFEPSTRYRHEQEVCSHGHGPCLYPDKSLPGRLDKIGMTEENDIRERLDEWNAPTNLPLSYRCYAVCEVEHPKLVEKHIHSLIDWRGFSLHAREQLQNGKIREWKFFKISSESAYGIFKDVATLRGDKKRRRPHPSSYDGVRGGAGADPGAHGWGGHPQYGAYMRKMVLNGYVLHVDLSPV